MRTDVIASPVPQISLASRRRLRYRARQRGAGPRRGHPTTLGLPVLWRRYLSELRIDRSRRGQDAPCLRDGLELLRGRLTVDGLASPGRRRHQLRAAPGVAAHLKEVGKQDWTCRTYLMALNGFTRWLNANGHLVTDPGARFRTPRLKRTIPILPAFHDLVTQLASEPSLRNRAILAIALYGGLRAAEIAGLRRAHFVSDQGLIGFLGKGQKQRSVALPPQALEIVRLYLAGSGARTNGASHNGQGTHPDTPLLRKEDGSGNGPATS